MPNIDHEATDQIVCPHCGYVHRDSWEFNADDAVIDCDRCENKFHYSRDVSVTYTTSKE